MLQLRNKPVQNWLDIIAKCSKIHLFTASWCHLFTIFTWWGCFL